MGEKRETETEGAIFWTDFSHATDAKRTESLIVRWLGEWRGSKAAKGLNKSDMTAAKREGMRSFH